MFNEPLIGDKRDPKMAPVIETYVPGPARSPALEPVSHAGRGRAWRYLDSRRTRGDARRRRIAGALKASPRLHFSDSDVGLASSFYLAGRGRRRARLRLADRPARPPAAVFHHSWALSRFGGRDRAELESRKLLPLPAPDRRRHWRRIQRRQFDHSGDDPGALSRPDRPCDQRLVLDRRRAGRGELDRAAQSQRSSIPSLAGASLS